MKITDTKLKIICVIPARLNSTRLKEKPLVKIAGMPLVRHVYENIKRIGLIDDVIIAADDERIVDAVKDFDGRVVLTDKALKSGTDRVAEACKDFDADVVVNVQCDEPFIKSAMIEAGLKPFISDPQTVMGSLKTRITSEGDLLDPNIVKVVTDSNDNALYFSRFPVPYLRDKFKGLAVRSGSEIDFTKDIYFKHLGIYFYRLDFLVKFSQMPVSNLECAEKLEQLRALESGYNIVVPTTQYDSVGVDTEEDLQKVRNIFKDMERSL